MNLNTEHRRMEDKSVTAFLLSPHYRTCRHLLLQIIVLLMTINVFWYEPLQSVSFWRRFGGFLAYFVSINTVIYMNLYILVPCFLLKNRLGHYVLAAVLTNLVVIVFLSVTQGLLFEVILPGKDPGRFATFINTFSGILTIGFVTAGSAAISLFTHWLRYNLRIIFGSCDPWTKEVCTREGVVSRNVGEYPVSEFAHNVFKYVRKGHVKTDEHWTRNWKRAPLVWEFNNEKEE